MKVLIVDDDNMAQLIARKILQSYGYEIILADNGEEALGILTRERIQIVISDWNMPEMDGIQLCQALRSNTTSGYIYIILVTSRSSKQDLVTGISAGANDFVTKPFEPAELLVRVRNAERMLALDTTLVTLFSLAKLAESKDPDTQKHLERIREYSKTLAQQLINMAESPEPLPLHFTDLLYQTSPMHDIGKVGIPDYVLLKPGSLNDDEWKIMKRHTEIGAETLNEALIQFPDAEFLRFSRDIAWAHHERWDGSGYPRGLKAENIPICARVVGLADVYDALTMKRVYKSAYSHEVARGIILENTGKHFDPNIVKAFLAVEKNLKEIRDNFPDD